MNRFVKEKVKNKITDYFEPSKKETQSINISKLESNTTKIVKKEDKPKKLSYKKYKESCIIIGTVQKASDYWKRWSPMESKLFEVNEEGLIFKGLTIYIPNCTPYKILTLLKKLIINNGGEVRDNELLNSKITHMIYHNLSHTKKQVILKLFKFVDLPKIVRPHWILDCIRAKRRLNCLRYLADRSENTLLNYFEITYRSKNNTDLQNQTKYVEQNKLGI